MILAYRPALVSLGLTETSLKAGRERYRLAKLLASMNHEGSMSYRQRVADDLRWMRDHAARLTQREMAYRLALELGRTVPDTSVSRWEKGTKLAGADVYRAYIVIAGVPLPTASGAADRRAMPEQRVSDLERRVRELELSKVPSNRPEGEIALNDLARIAVAAEHVGRTRQTIHNWIAKGVIRRTSQGRRILVSLADVIGYDAQLRET